MKVNQSPSQTTGKVFPLVNFLVVTKYYLSVKAHESFWLFCYAKTIAVTEESC